MSKNKLPSVTSQVSPDLRKWIDRVRELLVGSSEERFVTLKELRGAGVVDTDAAGQVTEPPDDFDNAVDIPVLTPPQPTGLAASGAIEYITLDWTTPTYYGHDFTEVWSSATDDIGTATFQYRTDANVVSDLVGPNQTLYYWIRFTNILGVEGPFSDSVQASTGYQVAPLLSALTDQITKGQLVGSFENTVSNVEGEYVVRADVNGIASGFAFVSTALPDGGVTSEFGVIADKFFILPPVDYNQQTAPTALAAGEVWKNGTDFFISQAAGVNDWEPLLVPFAVLTTPTTIDGEPVPAGVYINQALIRNASIDTAKIASLAVDTAKIADAAITNAKVDSLDASKVTTGQFQSTGFNNANGFAGWFLQLGTDAAGGQEDVQFIIRSSQYDTPALELSNGDVTINGLVIREVLRSVGWPASGFEFDIDNNTYSFKDTGGNVLMTQGGLDNSAVTTAISTELANLQADADAAVSTANAAQSTANAAQSTANAAVTPAELGVELANYVSDNDFDTLEGSLRAFAFLDAITPANVGTYINALAIGSAYIGNGAIGTAKIADLAVETAKIDNAAITNAKIGSAAVDTLKIAGNAVIPTQYDTNSSSFSPITLTTSYTTLGSETVTVPSGIGDVRLVVMTAIALAPQSSGLIEAETTIFKNGQVHATNGVGMDNTAVHATNLGSFVVPAGSTTTVTVGVRVTSGSRSVHFNCKTIVMTAKR